MSDTIYFGISRFDGEFIDEVMFKEKVETATRRNRVGETARVYTYDQTNDFSIKGGGEPPLALGVVASSGITGMGTDGVIVVKERTVTDKSTDFNEFEITGTQYPNATEGEAATVTP